MDRLRTPWILLIAVLWIVITVLGWIGAWLPAMVLGVLLMFAHMYLGFAREGKVDLKIWLYPLLPWAVLWVVGFLLSNYYANIFEGQVPSFTILGFHPSFAWTVLTYWIGGVLTVSFGFLARKKLWLSDEVWENFKKDIKELENQAEGGAK